MTKIIALMGRKGSGKSALAYHLIDKGYVPINFKDALIKEIREKFPRLLKSMSDLYGIKDDELFVEKPMMIRQLMQEYATEVRRGDCSNYWVEKWEQTLLNFRALGKNKIVVDDVRFINESEMIKWHGGTIIRIDRPGLESIDTHVSETEMDGITPDKIIINDTTVNNLRHSFDAIMDK